MLSVWSKSLGYILLWAPSADRSEPTKQELMQARLERMEGVQW